MQAVIVQAKLAKRNKASLACGPGLFDELFQLGNDVVRFCLINFVILWYRGRRIGIARSRMLGLM
jgi:hypothetical protein